MKYMFFFMLPDFSGPRLFHLWSSCIYFFFTAENHVGWEELELGDLFLGGDGWGRSHFNTFHPGSMRKTHPLRTDCICFRRQEFPAWKMLLGVSFTLPPMIMEVKNGCISNRIVTFQI